MSNGFLQLITKATRIQGNSLSSIDHVITNSLQSTNEVGTLINDISDHFINFMYMPTNKSRPKTSFINKRAMSKGNMERFKDCLVLTIYLGTMLSEITMLTRPSTSFGLS